jgi:hypothetical protein
LITEAGRAPFDRFTVFKNLFCASGLYITPRVYSDDSVPGHHRSLEMLSDTGVVSPLE